MSALVKAAATVLEVRRLGISELERRIHRDRSTIYRWYKSGRFPEPEYLADQRLWRVEVVEQWEAEQAARPGSERRCNLGSHAQAKP